MNGTVLAATPAMSAADQATHDPASYVRSGFSPAGEEALCRSYAAIERIIRDQVDAAYAEYAAQPLAAYNEWAQGVAA